MNYQLEVVEECGRTLKNIYNRLRALAPGLSRDCQHELADAQGNIWIAYQHLSQAHNLLKLTQQPMEEEWNG